MYYLKTGLLLTAAITLLSGVFIEIFGNTLGSGGYADVISQCALVAIFETALAMFLQSIEKLKDAFPSEKTGAEVTYKA